MIFENLNVAIDDGFWASKWFSYSLDHLNNFLFKQASLNGENSPAIEVINLNGKVEHILLWEEGTIKVDESFYNDEVSVFR
jgi:hypothetical protein